MRSTARREKNVSKKLLRQLLLESIESELGINHILDPSLPFSGNPLLLVDKQNNIALLCFDANNSDLALLQAITAMQQATNNFPLLAHCYRFSDKQTVDTLGMILVSPQFPLGADLLCQRCQWVKMYRFQVARAQQSYFLLLEEHNAQDTTPKTGYSKTDTDKPSTSKPIEDEQDIIDNDVELSDEERRFFMPDK